MEPVCMRDDDPRPHPTEGSAVPLIQADPLLLTPNRREFDAERPVPPSPSPSTPNVQHPEKSRLSSLQSLRSKLTSSISGPPQSKPLFRGFERPSFSRIVILTVLCLITYPAFILLTLAAKNKSLFTVRVIVSIWCSGIGFVLGYILLKIGAQHLEAASKFSSVDRIETL